MVDFEMQVTGIFKLQEYHTVFVGFVLPKTTAFIRKCQAQIILDDELCQTLTIEGEWLTENPCLEERAISTTDSTDISQALLLKSPPASIRILFNG
ncbi:MAG: hypothetical protein ACLFT0_14630 [Spirulinaceae cyanobacterium]